MSFSPEVVQLGLGEDTDGGAGVGGELVALDAGQRGVEHDGDQPDTGGSEDRTDEVGRRTEGKGDPVAAAAARVEKGTGGAALTVLGICGVQQFDGGGVPGHRHRRRLRPYDVSLVGATADSDDVVRARVLLEQASRVVVLTGAGISTDSGIADFRGPQGVWTKNPEAEKMATLQAYVSDPELRARSWQNRLTSPMWSASPNAGHRALVDLERSGRLDLLVTQNIDGLHQKAGSDPARLVEIHGTSLEVMCLSCGDLQPAERVHDRVRAGEVDPTCTAVVGGVDHFAASGAMCGGILMSATISFGQSLVAEDLFRAEEAAANCDLLLAEGSTLAVFPAASLVPVAIRHGAVAIIVNGGPTDMDGLADVVLRDSISECLPALVEGLTPTTARS
jgi:NAD-dependent deacetylase